LSGIGSSLDLNKNGIEPKVEINSLGTNVQDHPAIAITYTIDTEAIARFPSIYNFPSSLVQYTTAVENYQEDETLNVTFSYTQSSEGGRNEGIDLSPSNREFGVLASVGLCAGGFLRSPLARGSAPDLQLTIFPAVTEPHLTTRTWSANATPKERLLESKQMLITVALLIPDTRSKVITQDLNAEAVSNSFLLKIHLNGSRLDATPIIETSRELSVRDIDTLIWGIRQVRRIASFPPLSLVTANEVSPSKVFQTRDELVTWVFKIQSS
jgi:hypothetical protein